MTFLLFPLPPREVESMPALSLDGLCLSWGKVYLLTFRSRLLSCIYVSAIAKVRWLEGDMGEAYRNAPWAVPWLPAEYRNGGVTFKLHVQNLAHLRFWEPQSLGTIWVTGISICPAFPCSSPGQSTWVRMSSLLLSILQPNIDASSFGQLVSSMRNANQHSQPRNCCPGSYQ